jgi:hypothetical protein
MALASSKEATGMNCFTKTALAVIAAAALSAAPASAAIVTHTFDFTSSGGTASGTGYNVTRTFTGGGITLSARGFAMRNYDGGSGPQNDEEFQAALVQYHSGAGLGVCNQSSGEGLGSGCNSPEHQVGNDQDYDFILLQFDPTWTSLA